MRAHVVCAHPEPRSYNAHLAATARGALERRGWSVTLSDLYAMGFDPCERAAHYPERADPARFDAQAEQRHASQRRPAAGRRGRRDRPARSGGPADPAVPDVVAPAARHAQGLVRPGARLRRGLHEQEALRARPLRRQEGDAVGDRGHERGDLRPRRPQRRRRPPAVARPLHAGLRRLHRPRARSSPTASRPACATRTLPPWRRA